MEGFSPLESPTFFFKYSLTSLSIILMVSVFSLTACNFNCLMTRVSVKQDVICPNGMDRMLLAEED
jgi:hypothetical protein